MVVSNLCSDTVRPQWDEPPFKISVLTASIGPVTFWVCPLLWLTVNVPIVVAVHASCAAILDTISPMVWWHLMPSI